MAVLSRLTNRQPAAVPSFDQRQFDYVAASAAGTRHKGRMQANSAAAVSAALQADGWMPLSVTEVAQTGLNADVGALFGAKERVLRLSVAESATFFRQAAELLRAGVVIGYALGALGQEASPTLKKICDGLSERISAGVPLSEAMAAYPDAFDRVTRAYVLAGESSGTLPDTMARLAASMEKRNALRLKIKAVTAYPKMVSYAIGGIVLAILRWMVPMYEGIYASFGSDLPAPTRALVALSKNLLPVSFDVTFPTPFLFGSFSILGTLGRVVFAIVFIAATDAMRNRSGKEPRRSRTIAKWAFLALVTVFAQGYAIVPMATLIWAVVGGAVFGIKMFLNSSSEDLRTARLVDLVRFRMPLFGRITRLNAMFQWATTLAGAQRSGVSLARGVALAGVTSGSRWHAAASEPLQSALLAGRPLSEALADHSGLYPPSMRAMVATGEATGDLATMFESIARSIESDVEAAIAGLSARIEVALLVVMGVVVGGLLVALYLPIINLATTVGGF